MATLLNGCARSCTWTLRRYFSTTPQKRRITRLIDNDLIKDAGRGPPRYLTAEAGRESEHVKRKLHRGTKTNMKRLTDSLDYEILGADDPRLGRTILQMKSKKGRMEKKEIVIEGGNHIADALKANAVIKAFYFSSADLLQKFPLSLLPPDIPLYKVPNFKLNLFTDLATSPGVLGIFKMPEEDKAMCPAERRLPVTLVCDGIRDPAILGNLLQSAAAVGCERVILMKGCCDMWNSRVLRSSGMSQFYLPVLTNINWSEMQSKFQSEQHIQVYLLKKEKIAPGTVGHHGDSINNCLPETMSEQNYDQTDEELSDQDTDTSDESDSDEEVLKNKLDKFVEDHLYNDFNHLKEYKKAPVITQWFDDVDFTSGHSVVIVDENSSLQSKKFLYDNHGEVLHFPIASQLYGLTAATAGGLVLFEADKQYRKLNKLTST